MQASTSVYSDLLQSLAALVEPALDRYASFEEGCPPSLAEAIRYALLGPGKRLRPMLTLIAAKACGEQYQRAVPAACAVEMIHAYSLVHDDLPAMDDDDMRRGRPSCHVRFGEATAILVGDALQARAFEVIARHVRPAEAAVRCLIELGSAAGAAGLVGGQADDLAAETTGGSLEKLESIHRRKTGALFRAALRMGGHVALADDERMQALDRFAQDMGLAFQITDDLLDMHGDPSLSGRRSGRDDVLDKLTYPRLVGEQASRRRAEQLVQSACHALAVFGEASAGLESVAQFVLKRSI